MIEEKTINKNNKELIGTLEHFSWKKDTSNSKNTASKIVLTRDTEMPYYNEITRYESQYEEIKKELIPEYKLHTILFVFMTLMLIIPGLIYKNVVNNHNLKIEEHNDIVYNKMEEILDKAARYANA